MLQTLRPTLKGFAFDGAFAKRQPGTAADWKTKIQNFFKSPYAFGQPEPKMNKEPKVKVYSVAPLTQNRC